jgi:predicted unusual protein kinase regulating ubiquinone biosynthesis (AarF/ABC1/UbiB family)
VFRRRYRRIVGFFARVILSLLFWELLLPRIGLSRRAEQTRPARLLRSAADFRALAVEMGGVMIKLGQFLSSRLDVLPVEITGELASLQDDVPEEDYDDIRALLESKLDGSIEDTFERFDPTPMAAASLGQVHRAKLCSPLQAPAAAQVGDPGADDAVICDVIVKVQRPKIETIVATDLAALRTVGRWIVRYPPIRKRADVDALLGEFSRVLYQEIDYLAEGRNAETFAANFSGRAGVLIPRVVWPLTTRRVLTLEDVEGIKITDYAAIEAAGIDRAEVARRLFDVYLKQIFEDGFFHADPHPGNLFVSLVERSPGERSLVETSPTEQVPAASMPDEGALIEGGKDWVLTFVDFGMVGHIPAGVQEGLREAFLGVATQDAGRMVRSFQALGMLLPGADLALLEKAQARMMEQTWGRSIAEMQGMSHEQMMAMASEFRELIYDMPFQMPEDLIFLGRTVAILSGMCTGLDPGFNPWEGIVPYAQTLMAGQGVGQAVWSELRRLGELLLNLPGRVEGVLSQLERGELGVQTPQVSRRLDRLDRGLRRMTWAVVLVVLCLSGTQLLLAGRDGVGGTMLGLAGALFLWLLFVR